MIPLDWQEYFRQFCEKHGRHPIEIGNRLVFPDGWAYARSDYRGPEWPPPDDPTENWRLRHEYWKRRRVIVRTARDKLMRVVENRAQTQMNKDAPLQTGGIEEYVDDSGQVRRRYAPQPINWDMLRLRIADLTADLQQCEQELEALGGL